MTCDRRIDLIGTVVFEPPPHSQGLSEVPELFLWVRQESQDIHCFLSYSGQGCHEFLTYTPPLKYSFCQ